MVKLLKIEGKAKQKNYYVLGVQKKDGTSSPEEAQSLVRQ